MIIYFEKLLAWICTVVYGFAWNKPVVTFTLSGKLILPYF